MHNVVITLSPWKGDRNVTRDEGDILLTQSRLVVNGHEVGCHSWELKVEGGDFMALHILLPDEDVRNRYLDPATHGLGTDRAWLILPVRSLAIEHSEPDVR